MSFSPVNIKPSAPLPSRVISTKAIMFSGFPSYLNELMGKFIFFRSEEMNKQENRFKRFHHAGILRPMLRCCKSFDFSKLPDDIYKRYLFTTF